MDWYLYSSFLLNMSTQRTFYHKSYSPNYTFTQMHQGQLGVECLVQGYFDMWTGGARARSTNQIGPHLLSYLNHSNLALKFKALKQSNKYLSYII